MSTFIPPGLLFCLVHNSLGAPHNCLLSTQLEDKLLHMQACFMHTRTLAHAMSVVEFLQTLRRLMPVTGTMVQAISHPVGRDPVSALFVS